MKMIGHRETQRKTQSSTEVFLLQPKEKPLWSVRGINSVNLCVYLCDPL